ncbi:MAG: ABC transporter permease [Firmicutes bacterium]|nr:ABC transporter permease [Bacillota bacterium]
MRADLLAKTVTLRETLRLALETLRSHKLRSFLTLLGVILAVAALVVVMSAVEGLNRYVGEQIANFGANVFVVNQMGIITSLEEFLKAQRRPPITLEDFHWLRENMELAESIAAGDDTQIEVRYGNEVLEEVALVGVTPNFLDVRGWALAHGRFFTELDEQRRVPVCVVGADITDRFFPRLDAIGKTVRLGGLSCEIVGTLKRMGTLLGQSADNLVLIPLGTFRKGWSRPGASLFLLVQAPSPELMPAAEDEARLLLRARRHVPYHEPDNFGIIAPNSITSLWERLTGTIFATALGLTSVFMVVGGIVIMNIMLASVTERTREIGIRKALGARRRHIVMQFLVESAVLAATGGGIGLALAAGFGALVQMAVGFPMYTPPGAVAIALLLSTSVGLFFGIYPALRAARLEPVEAMRAET